MREFDGALRLLGYRVPGIQISTFEISLHGMHKNVVLIGILSHATSSSVDRRYNDACSAYDCSQLMATPKLKASLPLRLLFARLMIRKLA